jgi:mannose-6-phosphate isomerase-like protein (cupin superfamily)
LMSQSGGGRDTVLIVPGRPHCVAATGDRPLRMLCCCSPPYRHDDRELLEVVAH